jgi:DAK2 domain fusion protein YloV
MGGTAPVASQALVAAQHTGEGGLGFCTEFLVQHASEDEAAIRAFMESLGDSVIVVGDGDLRRVHVHTLRPGQALDWAVERGTVSRIKIENMQLQHDAGKDAALGGPGLSKIGVVAVSPGAGFRALFTSMGAAAIVEGGQTMNPSVQDILTAISSVGYQELVLLPNNGTILLAAQHAAEQTPRSVRVVPTRSLPRGIAALLAFNYEADLDTNVQLMEEAAGRVASIEVTLAERTADVDGQHVEQGQALGLLDDVIVAVAGTLQEAALEALAKAEPDEREIVTIYWGSGTSRDQVDALSEAIHAAYPHLETEIVEGGQPHYPYIISVE